jgi:hypothetical protein
MQQIAALRLLGPCVFTVPSLDGEAMETTRRIGILVAVQKLRLHTSPCARDGAEEIAILPSSVADASRITSRYPQSVFMAFLVGEVVV